MHYGELVASVNLFSEDIYDVEDRVIYSAPGVFM